MATDTEGFDLAFKLQRNPDLYRDIPILHGQRIYAEKMAREGPEPFQHVLGESPGRWPTFLEKPIDPEELLSVVDNPPQRETHEVDVGHEIIKEQLYFSAKNSRSAYTGLSPCVGQQRPRPVWWVPGVLCLAGLNVHAGRISDRPVAGLICFSVQFCFLLKSGQRLERGPADIARYQVFAHVQILADLAALIAFILLTGGLASPIIFFVFFQVILAGILLSPLSCYLYSALTIILLTGLLFLHRAGLVPIGGVSAGPAFFSRPEYSGGLIPYFALDAALLIAAFLTTSIKSALRFKGRELMKVSRDLEASNARLKSLYDMIKEIETHTQPQDLLDSATRNAALTMGAGACSIKLLEQDGRHLRFASTYGLSRDYLAKESIDIEKSEINRRIIDGSLYTTGNVHETGHFQYPEDVRHEGIMSMLCLPLRASSKTLGVYCVYSREPDRFDEADAAFFSLMTDLTALAMEHLNRERAKTWFLNRAAHQLRSPLGTVQSMLKTLTGGWLGPLNDRQAETAGRCSARLAVLQDTVRDLLVLADERREDQAPTLRLVDPAAALTALAPAYAAQARERGLDLDIRIADDLPRINAREKFMDDLYSNLISNALKYTPQGGRVTVDLTRGPEGALRLEVSDTGIGIPGEDLPRLFSEFHRAENAKEWSEEGTGLGLTIVKEILDILGGSIRFSSRLGQGTSATCLIPPAEDYPDYS